MKEKTKLWCLHMPKTGGTWAKNVIENLGLLANPPRDNARHEHTYFAKKLEPVEGFQPQSISKEEIKNYISFAIVRNPFDLLVSHWSYYGERSKRVGWGFANQIHNIKTFEEYIFKFTDPDFPWFCKPMQKFLFFPMYDDNGHCSVDWVLYNKNLTNSLNALLLPKWRKTVADAGPQFGRRNRARDKDYRQYYTDKMRELVENHCKEELNLFGYTFDGPKKTAPINTNFKNLNIKPDLIF